MFPSIVYCHDRETTTMTQQSSLADSLWSQTLTSTSKDPELLREMRDFKSGTEMFKTNLEYLVVTDAKEAVGGT